MGRKGKLIGVFVFMNALGAGKVGRCPVRKWLEVRPLIFRGFLACGFEFGLDF